jgi:hypothetical protein
LSKTSTRAGDRARDGQVGVAVLIDVAEAQFDRPNSRRARHEVQRVKCFARVVDEDEDVPGLPAENLVRGVVEIDGSDEVQIAVSIDVGRGKVARIRALLELGAASAASKAASPEFRRSEMLADPKSAVATSASPSTSKSPVAIA